MTARTPTAAPRFRDRCAYPDCPGKAVWTVIVTLWKDTVAGHVCDEHKDTVHAAIGHHLVPDP